MRESWPDRGPRPDLKKKFILRLIFGGGMSYTVPYQSQQYSCTDVVNKPNQINTEK